jgi:arylsulfatase A-like enzyme
MNRRDFLKQTSFAAAGLLLPRFQFRTKHLIFIVSCGARKRDYYEDESLSPNIHRLAREGFVFEEDHCERVASHDVAFMELLQGREFNASDGARYPTVLDYIGNSIEVDSITKIPGAMQNHQPRIVVCREASHEVGHNNYEEYLRAVKTTDESLGAVFNWVKAHPRFSHNTSIVIRPEFGRDDEVNEHGQLHHSYGFYYTHRVASIFWGPDFNRGIDRTTVIHSLDMAPTLTQLFGVDAIHAQGLVIPKLFRVLS